VRSRNSETWLSLSQSCRVVDVAADAIELTSLLQFHSIPPCLVLSVCLSVYCTVRVSVLL